MIINTGQRTDIPAFYAEWLINRIREGFVMTRNPFNESRITKYYLSPDYVDIINFCTKNPEPMLKYMDELKKYKQFWYVSITPYGKEIEPNVPDKERVLEGFIKLSETVGINSTGWRYDPIFINEIYTVELHIREFEKMAKKLSGYTKICVISFIDLYGKVLRNFPEVKPVPDRIKEELGKEFIKIAKNNGMTIYPCSEGKNLEKHGANCNGCMTAEIMETAIGEKLAIPKFKPAREGCVCYLSNDIGAYDTCGHFCKYCYANSSIETVKRNMKLADVNSPLITGNLKEGDIIREAEKISYIDRQISFLNPKFNLKTLNP